MHISLRRSGHISRVLVLQHSMQHPPKQGRIRGEGRGRRKSEKATGNGDKGREERRWGRVRGRGESEEDMERAERMIGYGKEGKGKDYMRRMERR